MSARGNETAGFRCDAPAAPILSLPVALRHDVCNPSPRAPAVARVMQIQTNQGMACEGSDERPVWPMRREPAMSPRVLLAEDDAPMRALVASVLRAEGCEVVETRDLEHLVDIVAGHANRPDPIALIISDIRMPGLSGLESLAALRAVRWPTPVLLITG